MQQFGEFTDKMRVRFWLFEIAQQLSFKTIESLFCDNPLETVNLRSMPKREQIEDLFCGIGREKLDLERYFNSLATPIFKDFNNKKSGVGDKIEHALPYTKKAFVNGPAELFDIVQAQTSREAILCFLRAVGFFFKQYNYVHEHYVTEYEETIYDEKLGRAVQTGRTLGGHTTLTNWATISEHMLGKDVNINYQNVRCYLPSITHESSDNAYSSIPDVWFLVIADAFIQAKFFNNSTYLCRKLIINSDLLLDIEKKFHINRSWWFAHPIFEQERAELIKMKEPVYFEKYKLEAYLFEDDYD